MTLWLVGTSPNRIRSIAAVREALRAFNQEASAKDASDILDNFDLNGFAIIVGNVDDADPRLTEAMAALSRAECIWETNLDAEAMASKVRAKRMTAEGATPEEVFAAEAPGEAVQVSDDEVLVDNTQLPSAAYETAMALMPAVDGHPLRAAALAFNLARTSGQVEHYSQVMAALVKVFPWLRNELVNQGMMHG